jgi:polyketide cyclase/dehydrase/lipid transport protein
MPPVITTTDVDRAAADVFADATDPARFHEWQAGVTEGHLDHPGPVKARARCLTTRRIAGATRAVTSEVTHVDPPRTWGVHGIDGPIRATVDLTVEPLTDGPSRLTIAVGFEGHGIGKVLLPLLARHQAQKETPANIATLKRRIEAQQPQPGP